MGSSAVADPMFVPSRPIHSYPVSAAGHSEIRTIVFTSYYYSSPDPTPDIDPCRHWAGPNRGY